MQLLEDVTCGVEGHEPDCLCDVVIETPVEILPDLSVMWGFERVKKWTNPIEAFMRLTEAHDMLKTAESEPPKGTAEQRVELQARLHRGEPIERALVELNLSIGDFVLLVTNSPRSKMRKWTIVDAIEAQSMIASGVMLPRVMDLFTIDKPIAARLFAAFGREVQVESDYRRKLTDAQREQVREWSKVPGVACANIVRRCSEEFNVTISRQYVSMLRNGR